MNMYPSEKAAIVPRICIISVSVQDTIEGTDGLLPLPPISLVTVISSSL
jgi:hypothetical protein